jgi:riboflavin biosynthesis pyrimidine reductase
MAMGNGFEQEQDFIRLHLVESKQLGDGLLLHYQLKK